VLGEETGTVMVDRNLLRKVLMKNLDVQYNRHLTTYESGGDSVTARFKDGSSARGTLLVGADGSNSRVRANLLDGFVPTPSRAIMLNGSVQLSRTEWEPILQHGSGGLLFGEPGLKGNILLGEYLEGGTALINWCIAWLSAEAEKDLAWTKNASRDTLFEKAKELFSHLPSYITDAVNKTGPEGMQTPPLRLLETVLPDQVLPSGPVTLVGDAAHSMVRQGAVGPFV
jgi:2-polyprenyl-6-methoxyphenol hydroxylase-like FAD-dependent oxidoreductase